MKPVAFVFPGQGSQSVGMLDAWGDHLAVRETLREASEALGEDLGALIQGGPKEDLALTTNTHNKQDLRGRLLFVDSATEDPFGAISVLNDPQVALQSAKIRQAVAANFLVRTRADADTTEARTGDTTRATAALQSGAHFISTDFPESVPGFPYRFVVPQGMPARCNPLSAPKSCTPLALEDPAFVGSYSPP